MDQTPMEPMDPMLDDVTQQRLKKTVEEWTGAELRGDTAFLERTQRTRVRKSFSLPSVNCEANLFSRQPDSTKWS